MRLQALALFLVLSLLSPALQAQTAAQWIDLLKKYPPGTPVEFTQETKTQSAEGRGSGVTASGTDVTGKVKSEAPDVSLDRARGGSADTSVTSHTEAGGSPLTSPYLWGGVLCLAAAAVMAYRGSLRYAGPVALAGGLFILAAFMPTLAAYLVMAGVVLKLLGGFHAVEGLTGSKTAEGLRSALEGLTTLPASAQGAFDTWLSRHAESRDAATIRAVRNMDDLHPKPS